MRDAMKKQQAEFGQRLRAALVVRGMAPKGTVVAREFNIRNAGLAIAPQTAAYWLAGKSMPYAGRLKALADLLDTTPSYLAYGEGTGPMPSSPIGAADIEIALDFQQLNAYGQRIVRAMISTMLGLQTKPSPDRMLQCEEQGGFDVGQGERRP